MEISEFANMVADNMEFAPTKQQRALIDALSLFCWSPVKNSLPLFLLNGYAGTGKTSVMAALVKALASCRRQTVLLAPTGRAAKVLSSFAGRKAFTIHRKIYRSEIPGNFIAVAGVADNPHRDAIFIVDEASMIGGGDNSMLLSDLLQYVYSGDNSRMILLGDEAQLPPVGCETSPAMSAELLRGLGLRVSRAVLTETVRQKSKSGILYNATLLRRSMQQEPLQAPQLVVKPFSDVKVVESVDLEDELTAAYSRYGIGETILITRSNKRAMEFNLAIRGRILEKEETLTRDEPVLIAQNNYYWTSKIKGADFIANGDIAIVNRIYGTEIRGMLRFADVELTLPDRDLSIDAKLILNSLNSTTAGLEPDHEQQLMELCSAGLDPAILSDPAALGRALKGDPYFNALRVKYAYAVTCHKAQGGQWESVFVDMGGINPDAFATLDFQRWLYTATTRAHVELNYISPTLPVK